MESKIFRYPGAPLVYQWNPFKDNETLYHLKKKKLQQYFDQMKILSQKCNNRVASAEQTRIMADIPKRMITYLPL